MAHVFVFPSAVSIVRPTEPVAHEPLVAFDPLTGESEVIIDAVQWSTLPEGALEAVLPVDEPVAPMTEIEAFRAVIVPRRLRGLERKTPLTPGTRSRMCGAVLRPPLASVTGGLAPQPAGTELLLTEFPVNVTGTGAQPLELAREVLHTDEITFELQVLNFSGASPSITVELQTSMQIESTTGWVSAGTFSPISSAPAAQLRPFSRFLRYIRWNVSAISGTSATFFLSGVERRWSRVN